MIKSSKNKITAKYQEGEGLLIEKDGIFFEVEIGKKDLRDLILALSKIAKWYGK
jgi:hypothetical protein